MKTLIIYDSYYGNTQKVAELYHKHLAKIEADIMKVDVITQEIINRYEMIIVGAPTRAFNMTSKVKKLIKKLEFKNKQFHVFDTRADINKIDKKFLKSLINKFGYAAEKMQAKLKRKHATPILEYKYYYVEDTEGPLVSDTEKEVIKNVEELQLKM